VRYCCLVQRTEAGCRTAAIRLDQIMVSRRRTSRVKSPDTPQEVDAAARVLVEIEEIGMTVSVAGALLETGISLVGDVSPIVTVTVTSVGAGTTISLVIIQGVLHYIRAVGGGCGADEATVAQLTVLLPSQLLGHETGVPRIVAVTHSQTARRRPSSPERFLWP